MLDFVIFAATFVIFLIITVIYLYPGTKKYTTIPGPDPVDPIEGNLPDIASCGSLHEFLVQVHADYGSIISFWLGQKLCVSVASPKLFEEQSAIFDRPYDVFEALMTLTTDQSVHVTNGGDGRRRHAAYSKCYTQAVVNNYSTVFNKLSDDFVKKWSAWPKDEYIPLQEQMFVYTIRSILVALFGDEFHDEAVVDQIRASCQIFINETDSRFKGDVPEAGGTRDKRLTQHKESLIKSLRDTLRRRKDHPPSEGNEKLFGDTITSLDLSESTLQADLVTMFIDGFQAMYPLLLWSVYYLALDEDVQKKARAEVTKVVGLETEITPEMTEKFKYLQSILKETIRMVCVVPYTARMQEFDSVLGGHKLPAGTPVVHALGVVFHDPTIYPEPERFDPERFSEENIKSRPTLSFEPFGFAGKRKCPGFRFALSETTILLAHLLRSFNLIVAPDQVVVPVYGVTVKAQDEIWLTLKPVSRKSSS